MKRKVFAIILLTSFIVCSSVGGLGYRALVTPPRHNRLEVADLLVDHESSAGVALLESAVRADYDALLPHFETQERASWCGVASSVTVLNTLGRSIDQQGLFTSEAAAVRSGLMTTLAGMTLDELGGLIGAHDAQAQVTHAEDSDVDSFRDLLRRNLADDGDFVIVNYLRGSILQAGGGHISPIGAYDQATDRALLMDVATYKYPPVWVEVPALFAAMNTVDSSSGRSRGWVEVR